jgi:hypothetical protein
VEVASNAGWVVVGYTFVIQDVGVKVAHLKVEVLEWTPLAWIPLG